MTHLYEGMFLLDNDVVRGGWKDAKAGLTGLLEKHGAEVHTARRWDERPLAYKIRGRGRATYVLCHFDLATDEGPPLVRDLELNETVLRHLILRVDEVPEKEREASQAELAEDFLVPPPPVETAPAPRVEEEEAEESKDSDDASAKETKGEEKAEAKADEKSEAKAEKPEAKPEAKADEKPEAKADEKPEAKADEKPAKKAEGSEAKASDGSDDEKEN